MPATSAQNAGLSWRAFNVTDSVPAARRSD
jgi:hypothetical protein